MKKVKLILNNIMLRNVKTYKALEKINILHSSTKCPMWLTTKDVVDMYTYLTNKFDTPMVVFHEHLISDALYYPIKDIIFYESRESIFTRICKCTYLIGHTVSTCNVPLMVTVFLTLCKLNNIAVKVIDEKWINVFTDAYNKKINPEAFNQMLTDLKVI